MMAWSRRGLRVFPAVAKSLWKTDVCTTGRSLRSSSLGKKALRKSFFSKGLGPATTSYSCNQLTKVCTGRSRVCTAESGSLSLVLRPQFSLVLLAGPGRKGEEEARVDLGGVDDLPGGAVVEELVQGEAVVAVAGGAQLLFLEGHELIEQVTQGFFHLGLLPG
ncbi:hypothetical protein SY28_03335 [Meiothermus taiwanensis]|nr:hypothetical protein SY28_03335 [Meiothermus taiwanensis]KZK16143.1 hypothetical protein A3962_07560 [Meiothermus taiwanensis]